MDVIELVNHETILAQTKKDLESEKKEAVQLAIDRERAKFQMDMEIAKNISKENARIVFHMNAQKTQINKAESTIRLLESEKATLEHNIAAEREKVEQHENFVRRLRVCRALRVN